MTWWTAPRPADPEQSDDGPRPWRAGAALTPRAEQEKVVLDAWDDELSKKELQPKPSVDEVELRARRRATFLRAANLGLFALAVIGALAGVAVAWMHVVGDPLNDAHAYYEAATRLNQGKPLYPAGIDPTSNHIYLYPPLLAMVLRPLALLPYEWFALVWELIVVATFVWLLQHLGVRRPSTWIAVGLLGIPIGWALPIAQAHIPMTLLMALGQPWSIAMAANIKLFPVLIALHWLGRREWESLLAFLVWAVLIVGAQLLLDATNTLAYFRTIGFDQVAEGSGLRNISPSVWLGSAGWLGLLLVGCLVILVAARTRWGWATAVTVATLAPPRLLVYMLSGLLAAVRTPRPAGEPADPDASDPALAAARSFQ